MLTPEQEEWIESRREDKFISVVPYDPRTEELFKRIKDKIITLLGPDIVVEHTGASSLGISGQDEIDVSIVTSKDKFDAYIPQLETIFGEVRARYPERVRFEVREEGKKIDLKMIDMHHPNYTDGKLFEAYLKKHPDDLERYRILKEASNNFSVKEYYRAKTHFINEILDKAKNTV